MSSIAIIVNRKNGSNVLACMSKGMSLLLFVDKITIYMQLEDLVATVNHLFYNHSEHMSDIM